MAILPIRLYGDTILRAPTTPVAEIDDAVTTLAHNMFTTQTRYEGIGLAAPQVGISRRVFVADNRPIDDHGEQLAFVNPEILEKRGESVYQEGCLSFPGIFFDVTRPRTVTVRYLDLAGREQMREFDGVLARIILHEYDHLEGRLFIDTLNEADRERVIEELKEKGVVSSSA